MVEGSIWRHEMELAVAGLDSGLCVVTDFRY
jgi:hypothetical protein